MKKTSIITWAMAIAALVCLPLFRVWADGGYVSRSRSVAVSADQRAIIIKNGDEISMTFSTGYTGGGDDFGWIIPVPVPPAIVDVSEAGKIGEAAFKALDQYTAPQFITTTSGGCFPSGTEVLTADGLRAIEIVEPGTKVHACDVATGEWVLATVLRRQSFHYSGDMITIRMGGVVIRATGNHPFFVTRGKELSSRPLPQDVPAGEREITSRGRWVEARNLREGDALMAKGSGGLEITSLTSRQETTDVCCLAVERFHNCAITQAGILVHNMGKKAAPETSSKGIGLVTVYGTVTLEHYEASILGAADSSALMDWLRTNEYQVNSAASAVLDSYIDQRWAFVAVKLNPSEKRHYENEFLPPLTIRYRLPVPIWARPWPQAFSEFVFPLRISSVSTAKTVKITLYAIAESTVSSTNLVTTQLPFQPVIYGSISPEGYVEAQIRESIGTHGRGMVVLWSGEYGRWDVDLYRACIALMKNPFPAGARTFLTRLETRIDQAAMTEDITLKLDPQPSKFHVKIEER
jgi:hypothetical protein